MLDSHYGLFTVAQVSDGIFEFYCARSTIGTIRLLRERAGTPHTVHCLARSNTGVNFGPPQNNNRIILSFSLIPEIDSGGKVLHTVYVCLSKIESFRLGD